MTRENLLPKLANHVLEKGLGTVSLRPLAKAAGTSDRMLIYHFGNKERLIIELLEFLAGRYAALLDAGFTTQPPKSRRECLDRILAFSATDVARPYLTVWWDIVAGAAKDSPGYRSAAKEVMQTMLDWLSAHMPPNDPDPVGGARYLLTIVEGAQMLEAVGRGDIAQAGIAAMPDPA